MGLFSPLALPYSAEEVYDVTTAQAKAARSCTWWEIAIAFTLQTGYNFGGLDLRDSSRIVASATRRLNALKWFRRVGNLRVESKCQSSNPIVGYNAAGVLRRPKFPPGLWQAVAENLEAAHTANADRQVLGFLYQIKPNLALRTKHKKDEVLFANVMIAGHNLPLPYQRVAAPVDARRRILREGPCHFGCRTTSSRAGSRPSWHGLPRRWEEFCTRPGPDPDPVWLRLPANVVLCGACHNKACKMARENCTDGQRISHAKRRKVAIDGNKLLRNSAPVVGNAEGSGGPAPMRIIPIAPGQAAGSGLVR